MVHLIYQVTNNSNGKIYVGAHTGEQNDDYMGSGKGIAAAIRKYGRENFTKHILHECRSIEEMFAKEAEIVTIEFVNRPDTYNRVVGGRRNGGYSFNEEDRRRRISEAKKGKPAWNKGMKMNYSPEALQKMSESSRQRKNRLGSTPSEETRAKMRAAKLGKPSWNKGVSPSPETREKLRQANLGKRLS